MMDNDLILRMVTDLETKGALKQADNFINTVKSKVNHAFKRTDIFKDVFKKSPIPSRNKLSDMYEGIAKDGRSVIRVVAEVNKKSGKLTNYTASTVSSEDLISYFDLDPSQYQVKNPKDRKKGKGNLSGFGKILNRFKSYGLLRVVRTIFMAIEKGLSQGIEKLTAFDKQADKTMASIQSSSEKVFGGIAVAVMPIIEAVAPMLDSIANVVADIGNSISRASAEAKGMSTYTKVNLDYLKQSANEANKMLATFDKFETLNGKESPFITGSVEEDKDSGLLAQTKAFLAEISGILLAIGSYKLITWIQGGGLGKIKDSLGGIKGKLDDINSIGLATSSVAIFVSALINLIQVAKDWKSQSLVTQISAIVSVCMALFGVIASIVAIFKPTAIAKGLAVGAMALASVSGVVSAMRFEDGGVPDRGSLFIAGESGAELVHTMPSGQTGVTNIAQFKQAMVEALYEASDVFQNENGDVVLNLDGAEVARSKRFKSELNRTNSGLNLR